MNLLGLLVDKGLLSKGDRLIVEAELAAKERFTCQHTCRARYFTCSGTHECGETYGLPARILGDPPANKEAFGYIPIDSARHYGFVPLDIVDGALDIGITDPDNIEAFDALQFISGKIGMPYKITLITQEDFDRVLDAYQDLSGEVEKALSEYEMVAKSSEVEFSHNEKTPAPGRSPMLLSIMKP